MVELPAAVTCSVSTVVFQMVVQMDGFASGGAAQRVLPQMSIRGSGDVSNLKVLIGDACLDRGGGKVGYRAKKQ